MYLWSSPEKSLEFLFHKCSVMHTSWMYLHLCSTVHIYACNYHVWSVFPSLPWQPLTLVGYDAAFQVQQSLTQLQLLPNLQRRGRERVAMRDTCTRSIVHDQSRTCICTRKSKQGKKVSKAKSEGRQWKMHMYMYMYVQYVHVHVDGQVDIQ